MPRRRRRSSRGDRAGAHPTLGGLPMLIYQGALAFELWTGVYGAGRRRCSMPPEGAAAARGGCRDPLRELVRSPSSSSSAGLFPTEMFQHRAWRQRVESGDVDIVRGADRRGVGDLAARPAAAGHPGRTSGQAYRAPNWWPSQRTRATLSTSAEGEFRTEGGRRVSGLSALDEAIAVAAKLST